MDGVLLPAASAVGSGRDGSDPKKQFGILNTKLAKNFALASSLLGLQCALLPFATAQTYRGQQSAAHGHLRPVPRQAPGINSRPTPSAGNAVLQWRTSSRVATDKASSDRVFTSRDTTTTALQVAKQEPQLQPVRQAAWMNHPQRTDDLFAPPETIQSNQQPNTSPAAPNFFDDPFGDDSSASALPPPVAQPEASADRFRLPDSDAMVSPVMPSESRPMNELRDALSQPSASAEAQVAPEPLQVPGPLQVPESLQVPEQVPANDGFRDLLPKNDIRKPDPTPEAATPDPLKDDFKADSQPQSSLGEMLRSNRPDEGDAELPKPKRSLDRSDDELFDNPFERLRKEENPEDEDARDRDALNRSADDPGDGVGAFGEQEDEDLKKPSDLSCTDFRSRIAAQTIDQVSLDISAPYRPDEIDVKRYEKLKSEFDEKQSLRQWRNIDGTVMATGRLRDLAYEKAVIETEYGSAEELPVNRLSEGDLAYISENWGLPKECLIEQVAYTPRSWTPTTMTWKASNLCHTSLYFEDVNLERYGHTHGPLLEPLVQSAHFFGNIAVLPYKMGIHAPDECQYALGYYRPGNCAPWIKPPVPLSLRGALSQAAVMTGAFWLIP